MADPEHDQAAGAMAADRHERQTTIRPALTLLSVVGLRLEPRLLEMPRGRSQAVGSRRVALIVEANKASQTRCGHRRDASPASGLRSRPAPPWGREATPGRALAR